MNEIIVRIDGGCVSPVNLPPGIKLIVRDYDIEGQEEEDLTTIDGEQCRVDSFMS